MSFTNGRYFRYEVLPINHAAEVQLGRLPHGYTMDIRTDSLLAEVLLEGPAELLRTSYKGIAHYLIRCSGQPCLELSERKYLRTTATGSQEVADGNNYQSQLELYFGDYPAARTAAAKAPFTVQGVGAVVEAYSHACAPTTLPGRSWLAQARPRRRLALQGGLLAGLRYSYFRNGYESLPETLPCTDCRPRPFAGLYADLLQPGRTRALYGELSLSRFSNQDYEYYRLNSYVSYYVIDYNAWLISARLGLRFFFPLPHEQQWLLSLAYELSRSFAPTITSSKGAPMALSADRFGYGLPSLLPNLGLGWVQPKLSLRGLGRVEGFNVLAYQGPAVTHRADAQGQDPLCAVDAPALARALQAPLHHRPVGRLDGPRANQQPAFAVRFVIHPVAVRLQVRPHGIA